MYNEVILNMAQTIVDTIKQGVDQWGKFDKQFKAVVKKKVGGSRYIVTNMDHEYTVYSPTALTEGDIVRVCAPQNNWTDLFVVMKVS